MEEFYSGRVRTIIWTADAVDSWPIVAEQDPTKNQACAAQLLALLRRLGDFHQLQSPDQINPEGDKIYAVKARCGLRAYGWFGSDEDGRRLFVVSHFIMKKKQKLSPGDLRKAKEIRDKFEKD